MIARPAGVAIGRRALVAGATSVALGEMRGRAESAPLPARLQVDLLAKAATYDRHFAERAQSLVRVLIVKTDDPDSTFAAAEIREALSTIATVGDLPHETRVETFQEATSLAQSCRAPQTSVVYLGLGLGGAMRSIREALASLDILSVAAKSEYVADGSVLGFDLVSGRPKIAVNLSQARLQHVDFRSDFLKLCKVYE